MGFFKKLKERLFKSSSKIDEGLDAIIEDGGKAEEVELEEDLKTQEETVDYATNDQTDIEPVLIESQLEQNAPTRSAPIKTEEKKEQHTHTMNIVFLRLCFNCCLIAFKMLFNMFSMSPIAVGQKKSDCHIQHCHSPTSPGASVANIYGCFAHKKSGSGRGQ